MEVRKIKEMKGGWFIGDFEPSVLRTKDFEVCYKEHKQDEEWDTHYHLKATEVNYLISGLMTVNGTILSRGDIFTIYKGEVSEPRFLTDCKLIVVKVPSVINDKYAVL